MNVAFTLLNCINLCLFDRSVLPEDAQTDYRAVFALAKKHGVVGIVWQGLQRSGLPVDDALREAFQTEADKHTFLYLQQQHELERLRAMLEEQNRAFVVLKGGRMRDFYPSPELRTSCDIDLLVEQTDDTLRTAMEGLGYRFESDGPVTMDFRLPPSVSVELHRRLFDDALETPYFAKVWERTVPTAADKTERRLTETDFYVYMIAHLAKHVFRYGCGIRQFLDVYLYERRHPTEFDRASAERLLQSLGLLDFERAVLRLTKAWFETGDCTKPILDMTQFVVSSGLYGSGRVENLRRASRSGGLTLFRISTFLQGVFLPPDKMRYFYPRMLLCPALLPVAWAARIWVLVTKRRKQALRNYKESVGFDQENVDAFVDTMQEFHLQ